MATTLRKVKEFESMYAQKCHLCHCAIEPGDAIVVTGAIKGPRRHIMGNLNMRMVENLGKVVRHKTDCGQTFSIRCVYASTSLTLQIPAYLAADAIQVAFKKLGRSARSHAVPLIYAAHDATGTLRHTWSPDPDLTDITTLPYIDAAQPTLLMSKMPRPQPLY